MKALVLQQLDRERARYKREIVELTRELVALRTVNAGLGGMDQCPGQDMPGEETRAVDFLLPILEGMGARCEVHALHPRRANLLAALGQGSPTLCVGCHTDVVPPGDGWETDPFQVVERGGRLYGRGVLDNKGPLAATVVAMKLLVELGVDLDGCFQLAAIASEEYHERGEPDPGVGFLLHKGLLTPDFAIIPDIGEQMLRMDVAEKGRMELTITAIGEQAHGSTPERGVNAILAMAHLLHRVSTMELPYEAHPLLGSPTINPGLIRGGAAVNIVPAQCSATIDIRYVPGQTPDGIVREFQALTEAVGGKWRLDVGSVSLPHSMEPGHPIVGTIQEASALALGHRPEPFGMGGGTFAKAFNLGGIPAVGFGPGDDNDFHVANESIEVDQLLDFAGLLAVVAVDMLSGRER